MKKLLSALIFLGLTTALFTGCMGNVVGTITVQGIIKYNDGSSVSTDDLSQLTATAIPTDGTTPAKVQINADSVSFNPDTGEYKAIFNVTGDDMVVLKNKAKAVDIQIVPVFKPKSKYVLQDGSCTEVSNPPETGGAVWGPQELPALALASQIESQGNFELDYDFFLPATINECD